MAALLLAALLAGCAAKPPELLLTSQGDDEPRMFSTTFDEAYVARADDGSYDLILVSDGVNGHANTGRLDPAAPLEPTDAPPLRHLVHVRILWQPWHRSREADPTLTNASIHWYVTHRGIGRQLDLLRYDGAGHVTIDRGGERSKVAIRNAGIEPALQQGLLQDPIGPARVTGRILAEHDPRRVAQLLGEIRAGAAGVGDNDAVDASQAAAAAAAGSAASRESSTP